MRVQSVEWSRSVARIHSQLKGTNHYVLPDLPDVDLDRSSFFDQQQHSKKVLTLAAGLYTPESFDQILLDHHSKVDTFLIVGGNHKSHVLSSIDAISRAKSLLPDTPVWCVANPNDPATIRNVRHKKSAGADGVVTQPLLGSRALETVQSYALPVVCGVALPRTAQGLLFWLNLLHQPELQHDSGFQSSLKHFESGASPLEWAQSQITCIQELTDVDGIHYMPMKNTDLLLELLADENTA